MSYRDVIRLCLALAVSALFHALLLGTQGAATDASRVGLVASNRLNFNMVLAAKIRPHHEDMPQRVAPKKHPKKLAVQKIQKPIEVEAQEITSGEMTKNPSPDLPVKDAKDSAQAIGAALGNMVSQQYMMMRLQQFFFMSRENAIGIIKSRFTKNELANYQGKYCTLRLVVVHAPEQGYEIAQHECDDPDLAAELRAMPWNVAMPLPSAYSLPYRGLVINLSIGSDDIAIGLEPAEPLTVHPSN